LLTIFIGPKRDERAVEEYTYLCHQCQTIFRLPVPVGPPEDKEAKCSRCGGTHIERLRSWAPTGLNYSKGPPEWEYQCQQCGTTFKSPIGSSPTEEKEKKCPECGSRHIKRLTAIIYDFPHCG